ncbi:MAG: endonuclease III [Methanomicrobiales archaeon]|nr:endonuclease III [Methanomicrobiales archaeon]MDI6877482.1 endonuclease III [Methanomicrobiales archaeon]
MDRSTALRILDTLIEEYRDSGQRQLRYRNPFELLILTILSAQTTDRSVESVQEELFRRYPTPQALAGASPHDVDAIIRAVGFHRVKTRFIIETARRIVQEHGGEVPRTMEGLTALPGVGRKTANIVLARAFGTPAGIGVDTHVRRLSRRIGLSDHSDPVKIERDLMALYPREVWGRINFTFMQHGRAVCTARAPRHGACVIRNDCRCYREGTCNRGFIRTSGGKE